jgi:mediator of RNA polymerase II transcription subunit 17, fungi type
MNKDGGIILDPNLRLKPKTLRVRIVENEQTIGTSHLTTQEDLNKNDIEHSIQLSRDSLFEEELFHEMSMESRQLLGYGVELRNSTIYIATPAVSRQASQRKILIDCIDRDGQMELEPNPSQNWLARNIAEALRLLLAHEHRMRLYRRSQVPPPMADHGKQQSSPRLLRTLLAMFSHLDAVDSLHAHLHATIKTIKSAGLDMRLEASRESLWVRLAETIKNLENTDISAIDQLLQAFVKAFDASATIALPLSGAQSESIVVATRTYIGPPVFGSEHKLTLSPTLAKVLDLEPDQSRQFKFSSTQDVISYLDWILALYIAHNYLVDEFPGRSSTRSEDPRLTIISKGNSKGKVREDEIAIELSKGVLEVTATINTHLSTGATTQLHTWNGAAQAQPSLKDKVKSWIG